MSKRIDPPPKKELERLYIDELKPTRLIGIEYGCSDVTILKWLRRYGIPVRKRSVGTKTQFLVSQKDELSRLYHREGGGSLVSIGKLYGVSTTTIIKVFQMCDIPYDRRPPGKTRCQKIKDHVDKYKDDHDSLSPEFLQKMLGVRCEE